VCSLHKQTHVALTYIFDAAHTNDTKHKCRSFAHGQYDELYGNEERYQDRETTR
jgi:hypothetical protein